MKITTICKKTLVQHTSCEVKKKFCCKKMKQVFNDKWKNSYSDGSGKWYNAWTIQDGEVRVPVRQNAGYDYGAIEYWQKIDYCPFCGTKIEREKITKPIKNRR